jgi:signal transduction histidine kinase
LHDRVGQTLSALGAHLELARVALPARSRERARPHLARARELIELSTAHMRELMAELRPPGLEQYGLLAALRVYTRALVALDGAKLELRGKDLVPRPPLQIETALYRIAQEALVNALRHAQPQRVKVHLEQSEDSVTLSIADDGVGFDITRAGPRPSWGLDVMRERAEALGARLHVDSGPGRGTRVSVELPWAAA